MWHVVERPLLSLLLRYWLHRIEYYRVLCSGSSTSASTNHVLGLRMCVPPCLSRCWHITILPVGTYALLLLIICHFLKSVYSVSPWVGIFFFFLRCYQPQQSMKSKYNIFRGALDFVFFHVEFQDTEYMISPEQGRVFSEVAAGITNLLQVLISFTGGTWSHLS